ncbi:MAG: GIY-YIG nuclease family protein [Lachnospiraceae bacterium]
MLSAKLLTPKRGGIDIEKEKTCLIYKITNTINNYIYVGSTSRTLEERFQEHCKPSVSSEDHNPNSLFYKDIQQYGADNFKIELLDTCSERHRYILEEYWWHKLYDENFLMYEIKMGNAHSMNTKQRLSYLRNQEEKTEIYKTDEFKAKISEKTSGELNGMWGKKDEEAINGRIVIAFYDIEHTKKFKEFNSVKTALNFIGIKGHAGLLKACRENILFHGYYWTKEWIDR